MAKPFTTNIKVAGWGNGTPVKGEEIEVLIDTGAAYTSLPKTLLTKLMIPVWGKMTLRLANGQLIEREYGPCGIFAVNRWVGTTVLFAEEKDQPLLGMNTIDDASLEIDIANKKLVPVQAIQA